MNKEELNLLREDLMENVNVLDMTEVFSPEDIVSCVIDIAMLLGEKSGRVIDYTLHKFDDRGNKDYQIKVINTYGGSVSVSDDCCTGVSNTLYYPFFADEDGYLSGLLSLMDMINEAWYNCTEDLVLYR